MHMVWHTVPVPVKNYIRCAREMNFGSRCCDAISVWSDQSSVAARCVRRTTDSPSNDLYIAKHNYALSLTIQCPAVCRDTESILIPSATSIQDIFRDTFQASSEAITTCGPVDSIQTPLGMVAVDSGDLVACRIHAVDGRVVDRRFRRNPAVYRTAQTRMPICETHSAGEDAAGEDTIRDFQACHRILGGMVDHDRHLISFRRVQQFSFVVARFRRTMGTFVALQLNRTFWFYCCVCVFVRACA
mmetsp:Transcript_5393/g.18145  ORF Transcript_5393/g.18145 Transcript_5393/m.18145 type:complete len:244 (+) Transcript_5393:947-1678(+)